MKLYGLIGYPLAHSFSKKYFTEKFIKEDLQDYSYENFAIQSITDLPELIKKNSSLKGFNVTIPYKEKVLDYVTQTSPEVKIIGAANTIKIDGKKLVAYNTDVIGFEKSFLTKLKSSQKKALVLGTGGSSKAIQFVLQKLGIKFKVVSRINLSGEEKISYSDIDKNVLNEHTIIINCTPVGTSPNENDCPQISYEFISPNHYLFDLIYNPEKTLFLKKGEEKGATIQNGYDMLVIQAEESWKIWNEV